MKQIQDAVGWFNASTLDIPDQVMQGTGFTTKQTLTTKPSNTAPDIVITVKGSTSRDTLKDERPYFAQYTGSSSVLKTALIELGEASVDWYLNSIAQKNGVKGYSGTLTEDAKLLALLRQGKLIRP